MQETKDNNKNLAPGVWLVFFVCAIAVIFSLACGAAYAGIQGARQTAAKASLGQIESVFILAQKTAEESGLKEPEGSFSGMLKSYGGAEATPLSIYEKYVLETMVEAFGTGRDFDFAITRYEDGGGVHTYLYYFPIKGKTEVSSDKYYMMKGSQFDEFNVV